MSHEEHLLISGDITASEIAAITGLGVSGSSESVFPLARLSDSATDGYYEDDLGIHFSRYRFDLAFDMPTQNDDARQAFQVLTTTRPDLDVMWVLDLETVREVHQPASRTLAVSGRV